MINIHSSELMQYQEFNCFVQQYNVYSTLFSVSLFLPLGISLMTKIVFLLLEVKPSENSNSEPVTFVNQLKGGGARKEPHSSDGTRGRVCSPTACCWPETESPYGAFVQIHLASGCQITNQIHWVTWLHSSLFTGQRIGDVSSCLVRAFGCQTPDSRTSWTEASAWTVFCSAQLLKRVKPLLAVRYKHALCLQVIMFSHLKNYTAALVLEDAHFCSAWLFWAWKCFYLPLFSMSFYSLFFFFAALSVLTCIFKVNYSRNPAEVK